MRMPERLSSGRSRDPVPELVIVAGPNASGKSTLVRQARAGNRDFDVRFPALNINPDEIARALAPTSPDQVAVASGRAALAQRELLSERGLDFSFETTLSGRTEVRSIKTARGRGYRITLVYIGTESVVENLRRVERRRDEEGRSVERNDVRRRYFRSLGQLASAASLADRTFVVDNTHFDFGMILTMEAGRIQRFAGVVPGWVERALPDALRAYRIAEQRRPE
jgi:predicted ABC-type ATPase